MIAKTVEEYMIEIEDSFDWSSMTFESGYQDTIEEYGETTITSSHYLGWSIYINPSGKYYMPWCSNQTEEDVEEDSKFWEALEKVASKYGGYIQSGEGDPLDTYFVISKEVESE